MFKKPPRIGAELEMNDGSRFVVQSISSEGLTPWTYRFSVRDKADVSDQPSRLECGYDGRIIGHPTLRAIRIVTNEDPEQLA
jgi:hypothetical protein